MTMDWTEEMEIEVLRVVHPGELYVRLKDDFLSYERLKDQLRRYYSRSQSKVVKRVPCIPKEEDLSMYVVKHDCVFRRCVMMEKDIYLCDEGRMLESLEESFEFYKIPTFLRLIPPLCLRGHLVDMSSSTKTYSEEDIVLFKEQLFNTSIIRTTASFPLEFRRSPWFQSLPIDIVLTEAYSNPVESSFERNTSLYARCIVLKLIDEVQDFLTDEGPSEMGDNNYNQPLERGFPVKMWKQPIIPSEPGPHLARVTHIDCYGQVYLHLMSQVQVFREVRTASTMEGKINDFNGGIKSWKKGDVCLAVFEDDLYYRGIILDMRGKTAIVLYVDYGNLKEIELEELKVPYTNGEVPILTLRVVANQVIPAGGGLEWPRNVLEDIYSLIYYEHSNSVRFTMLPGHRGLPLPVLLEICVGGKWVSLSDVLIGSQHGVKGVPLCRESAKLMNDYAGNIDGIYSLPISESDEEDIVFQDQELLKDLEVIDLIDRI